MFEYYILNNPKQYISKKPGHNIDSSELICEIKNIGDTITDLSGRYVAMANTVIIGGEEKILAVYIPYSNNVYETQIETYYKRLKEKLNIDKYTSFHAIVPQLKPFDFKSYYDIFLPVFKSEDEVIGVADVYEGKNKRALDKTIKLGEYVFLGNEFIDLMLKYDSKSLLRLTGLSVGILKNVFTVIDSLYKSGELKPGEVHLISMPHVLYYVNKLKLPKITENEIDLSMKTIAYIFYMSHLYSMASISEEIKHHFALYFPNEDKPFLFKYRSFNFNRLIRSKYMFATDENGKEYEFTSSNDFYKYAQFYTNLGTGNELLIDLLKKEYDKLFVSKSIIFLNEDGMFGLSNIEDGNSYKENKVIDSSLFEEGGWNIWKRVLMIEK